MNIAEQLKEQWGIVLNPAQRSAVESDEKYTLLLAVPGSGKTTVLAARLAHRITNCGVDPTRMLNLTFNRETARDMQRRYRQLFGFLPGSDRLEFHTIHSFCYLVLKRYAQLYGREMPRLLSGVGGNPAARVLRERYRQTNGEYLTDELLEVLQNRIGYVKNRLLRSDQAEDVCPEIDGFWELYEGYESWKRENRWMDFDDMLTYTLDIFKKCPRVLAEFQSRYREISLDEAQDTSPVQFRILRLLAAPEQGRTRLFLVGDEDQSIYAFRGACPQELLHFSKEYPGALLLTMEQNYRSGRSIVEAANRLIRCNTQRYDKKMDCRIEQNASVERVRLSDFAKQYAAVEEILQSLPEERSAAVLYRNNASALPLVAWLRKTKLDFRIGERRFAWFSGTVVRDLTAYITLADDPSDTAAFSRIYYKLGYSRGIAERVREHAREFGGVFEYILALSSVRGKQREKTLEYREHFPELLQMTPMEALEQICEEFGYGEFLRRSGSFSTLRQEMHVAKSLAEDVPDLYTYLDRLEELERELREGRFFDQTANITLSTFHSAKGMEFDWVILLDLQDGILPADGVLADVDTLEAERRLFYVGVTRARERLILLEANKFHGEAAAVSPFIRSLVD